MGGGPLSKHLGAFSAKTKYAWRERAGKALLTSWGQVAESFSPRYEDAAEWLAVVAQIFQPK
jgi:hypothetical protein